MSFAAVSVGLGAVSLGTGIYQSAHKSALANRLSKEPRPTYQIPEEYKQNLAIAQNMARIGLPQQQYNNQVNGIARNQAGAVASLGNSANPSAGLAQIVRAGNDATGDLNAKDAMARQANQRYANQMRSQLGQQKLDQQQYNQFDKYSEDFNRAQALRSSASQDLSNGINGAAQLGATAYGLNQMGYGGGKTPTVDGYKNSGGQWYNKNINGGFDAVNPYVAPASNGWNTNGQLGYQGINSNYQIPY